jgi:phosphotransferase system HPr (HPr) family protein
MSEPRATRTVVVTDPAGVHARTAVAIAETVRRGKSQVTLLKDQQRPVAGTEVLQILTLVAHQGETVTLEAIGPDADAVLGALEPLFAGRFGDQAQESA